MPSILTMDYFHFICVLNLFCFVLSSLVFIWSSFVMFCITLSCLVLFFFCFLEFSHFAIFSQCDCFFCLLFLFCLHYYISTSILIIFSALTLLLARWSLSPLPHLPWSPMSEIYNLDYRPARRDKRKTRIRIIFTIVLTALSIFLAYYHHFDFLSHKYKMS